MAISIHAPRTGSDRDFQRGKQLSAISIHAPRTGSDAAAGELEDVNRHFNPRSPHGERHATALVCNLQLDNFNPRSPHGERRSLQGKTQLQVAISIHAPRTGSDVSGCQRGTAPDYFNPRSPHGERLRKSCRTRKPGRFQSTLPARGATRGVPRMRRPAWNFNPRSPHGERRLSPLRLLR